MADEKLEKIIKQIKSHTKGFYLEDVIYAQVQYADVQTTLLAATICARVDIIHYLVTNFNADPCKTYAVPSERHPGKNCQVNLLETALVAFLTRDDADRTPEGKANLLETIKYFLAKRVPVLPNEDPLEGPFPWAHYLANPELAKDGHPYYYLEPQCADQKSPKEYADIYAQMKWVRPGDANVFESALGNDVSTLKTQMNAAAKWDEPTGDTFLRIGDILPLAPSGPKP